jgi:hypothetical protein
VYRKLWRWDCFKRPHLVRMKGGEGGNDGVDSIDWIPGSRAGNFGAFEIVGSQPGTEAAKVRVLRVLGFGQLPG